MRIKLVWFLLAYNAGFAYAATPDIRMNFEGGLRWEQDVNSEAVATNGLVSLGVESRFSAWGVAGSFAFYGSADSASVLSVSRKQYELIPWLKYYYASSKRVSFVFGLGVGLFWESVDTVFFEEELSSSSGAALIYAGDVTLRYKISKKWSLSASTRFVIPTGGTQTKFDSLLGLSLRL